MLSLGGEMWKSAGGTLVWHILWRYEQPLGSCEDSTALLRPSGVAGHAAMLLRFTTA